MRIRRKTVRCLNCGHTLGEVYNYCPHCGQENNDNNVSFGTFVQEFFANYLSFDTRIGRSIAPFFFKPGFLTNQFNAGKRMKYVHPLRLYVIVSVLFFFLASLLTKQSLQEASLDDIVNFDESSVADDSVDNPNKDVWPRIRRILEDETLTDQQALDSLQRSQSDTVLEETELLDSSWMLKTGFHQVRRVVQRDVDVFLAYLIQNLPFVMFALIPLFALLLKLFYWRKRRQMLYVQHLVHSLHLHAFSFIAGALLMLVYVLFSVPGYWEDEVQLILLFIIGVYIFISFMRVYQQSWYKTLLKISILGPLYFFLLSIFGLSEAIISFLLF